MNPDILKLQNKIVKDILKLVEIKDELTVKCPTGSGKTIIMADFMNEMLLQDSNIVFFATSLSKSELSAQNHNRFLTCKNEFTNLNPYLISSEIISSEGLSIPLNYNIYSLSNDLYKINTKIKSIDLYNFFNQLKLNNKKIIWIKDEAHIETSNLNKLKNCFFKVVNFSATPKTTKNIIDIEMSETEAVNLNLIKNIKILGEGNIDEFIEAVTFFKKIKTKFNDVLNINPCMIVQISNSSEGEQQLENLKHILDIEFPTIHWMYLCEDPKKYESNDKINKTLINKRKILWKEYAKDNNSTIDIIIAKLVITEGWDIPRANMLFQVRDSKSETLTEQIIGRVRRNPILTNWEIFKNNDLAIELANTAYIWGNAKKIGRKFKRVKYRGKDVKITTTKLVNPQQQYKKNIFDVNKFTENYFKNNILKEQSIFDLHQKWKNIDSIFYEFIWNYIDCSRKWYKFSLILEKIEEEYFSLIRNYEISMNISGKESLAQESYFEETGFTSFIKNNVWEIITNSSVDDYIYHFDSQAEKQFADILKKIDYAYWTRNYYPNSKIYFEYINRGLKKSYPDFIAIDKNDVNHIFEVKSLNYSKSINAKISFEEYNEKINAISLAYKYASKVTKQIFYIPIKKNEDWIIKKYFEGTLTELNLEDFLKSINNSIKIIKKN